ncbi:hypothetical protein Dda_8211 [Drechslerella dactyloides]|uniref:Uncharacterized protein n=1 Tax=Drechslerella dactyloides TaxID=74499 RepID=A0AAD6IVT4_DREDA|nr:hypothetical protein Dda_8211 [Drechslerella dactyloides]
MLTTPDPAPRNNSQSTFRRAGPRRTSNGSRINLSALHSVINREYNREVDTAVSSAAPIYGPPPPYSETTEQMIATAGRRLRTGSETTRSRRRASSASYRLPQPRADGIHPPPVQSTNEVVNTISRASQSLLRELASLPLETWPREIRVCFESDPTAIDQIIGRLMEVQEMDTIDLEDRCFVGKIVWRLDNYRNGIRSPPDF